MVDISGIFKKLLDFYGSNLNFTNIKLLNVGISLLIILTVISGHLFKLVGIITINMNFISISDEFKSFLIIVIILHLYGLQKFSQKVVKESITTPEVIEWNCPQCKIPMVTHTLKCQQCNRTF